MKNMTRRDFLKGVGAGALGVAMVGVLGACGKDGGKETTKAAENGSSAAGMESGASEVDWPKEDINLLLAYGAGGDSDVCTRYMAEAVGAQLGVNAIVTNMGGSNGGIAAEEIMNVSEPEYNFLVINTSSLSINCITGIADYNYEAFEPISIFASYSGETLYVPKNAPYDTFEEFLDYAKENEVKMGVAIGGTLYAVAAAMKAAGYKFNIVDAGDGVDRVPATINGTIDCTFAAYASNRDYIENGDLKELATLCSEPIPAAPDLPCVCDYIDGVVVDTKFVILAQKGVDKAICQKFNDALQAIYENDKEYVKNIEDFSYQSAKPQTIEETTASLKMQYETFQNYAQYL
jgi:tripartite-type tricarboxylate transporter receptor subunit TctC